MTARTDWSVLRTRQIHESLSAEYDRHIPWLFVVGLLAAAVVYLYAGVQA